MLAQVPVLAGKHFNSESGGGQVDACQNVISNDYLRTKGWNCISLPTNGFRQLPARSLPKDAGAPVLMHPLQIRTIQANLLD